MKQYCFYQNYREVRLLVIHCSATRYDRDFPVEALRSAHKDRGFADIGYHYYITRDGELHRCRPENQIGAHASGWNDHSLGICYEGGLDERGLPADTSVVPCSISCGSYAVITRQRISWDITNSAPISARLAPASTRRKNIRNCIRLRDI